jgi:hypothetical protein
MRKVRTFKILKDRLMKKVILHALLLCGICNNVSANLIVQNMNATGAVTLQGSIVHKMIIADTLHGIQSSFFAIMGNGTVTLTNSTADHIMLSNSVVGPSDMPITLDGSAVANDITFTGAHGKVMTKNGSTIGGSVINGDIIIG